MNRAVLIPARGGSKRIPQKNIINLCGYPMIHYSIIESLKVTKNVFISTESKEIKNVCKQYPVTIIDRPTDLSQDDSTSNSVVQHFLHETDVDSFALVQLTSPLLESKYLSSGFELFEENPYDSVISVYETVQFYWDKKGNRINFGDGDKKRTQEIEPWLVENGAFYITNRECFNNRKKLVSGNVGFLKMPRNISVDVDNFEDLELAKAILKYKLEIKNEIFK
jgi:CMP-N-acetylneuraminic acid synthetase